MKNKTKEDIKQICTNYGEEVERWGIGTISYALTEEQFDKLFEYIEKNFVEKPKTKEVKADWEIEFEEKFVYSDGVIDEDAGEVLEWIKKNFVAKGEVREMIEDFVETLIFNCEHNFHNENVVFSDSIILELMKYLKLKSLE